MTSTALYRALAERYALPRWALLREVPSGTGTRRWRVADAVAVGLWPSDGYRVEGFEIKVSRRDWLRELRDPAKADQVARYCHAWWLVIPHARIVRDDEIPDGWGVLVLSGDGRLLTWRKAPERDPLPPGPEFVAALVQTTISRGPRPSPSTACPEVDVPGRDDCAAWSVAAEGRDGR